MKVHVHVLSKAGCLKEVSSQPGGSILTSPLNIGHERKGMTLCMIKEK